MTCGLFSSWAEEVHFSSISVQCLLLNLVLIISHNGSFPAPLSIFFCISFWLVFSFVEGVMVIIGWRIPKPFVYNYFFASSPRGANNSSSSGWLLRCSLHGFWTKIRPGLHIKWSLGRGRWHTNWGEGARLEDLDKKGKLLLRRWRSFISLTYSVSISLVKHFFEKKFVSCWNWTIIKHSAKLGSSASRWEQEGAKSVVFPWTQLFKHIQAGEAWGQSDWPRFSSRS